MGSTIKESQQYPHRELLAHSLKGQPIEQKGAQSALVAVNLLWNPRSATYLRGCFMLVM